jgi:hypothetical protein
MTETDDGLVEVSMMKKVPSGPQREARIHGERGTKVGLEMRTYLR